MTPKDLLTSPKIWNRLKELRFLDVVLILVVIGASYGFFKFAPFTIPTPANAETRESRRLDGHDVSLRVLDFKVDEINKKTDRIEDKVDKLISYQRRNRNGG